MDLDEARAILTDQHLTDVGSPLQLAVTAVLDALDAGEVTTDYAVRWAGGNDDGTDAFEMHISPVTAKRIARQEHGEAVQCTVRTWRSPWEVAK